MKKRITIGLLVVVAGLLVFVFIYGMNRLPSDIYDLATSDDSEYGLTTDEVWGDDVQIIGLPTGEYTYVRSEISLGDGAVLHTFTASGGMLYGAASFRSDTLRTHLIFFSFQPVQIPGKFLSIRA